MCVWAHARSYFAPLRIWSCNSAVTASINPAHRCFISFFSGSSHSGSLSKSSAARSSTSIAVRQVLPVRTFKMIVTWRCIVSPYNRIMASYIFTDGDCIQRAKEIRDNFTCDFVGHRFDGPDEHICRVCGWNIESGESIVFIPPQPSTATSP